MIHWVNWNVIKWKIKWRPEWIGNSFCSMLRLSGVKGSYLPLPPSWIKHLLQTRLWRRTSQTCHLYAVTENAMESNTLQLRHENIQLTEIKKKLHHNMFVETKFFFFRLSQNLGQIRRPSKSFRYPVVVPPKIWMGFSETPGQRWSRMDTSGIPPG